MEGKRIVIDARESGTSTGRYIDKLIEHLQLLDPAHEIVVLTKPHRAAYVRSVAPKFSVIETGFEEFTFGEQLGFKAQLDRLNPDMVHFGMAQQPVRYRGRKVTTVHDLTTLRFTNPDKNRLIFKIKQKAYKFVVKRAAQQSAAILTPSLYVKNDVVQFSGVHPDKVAVTYEAADLINFPAAPLPDLQNKQFIMYLGRPTPHKNLGRLVEAFARLRAQHPALQLVLAGKKDGNYRRIEARVQKKNIPNVIFTDFIGDAQLRWLYENCQAYVFPSLSEGFGLPGLEAMAQGAPVVSSNATCLPEIYGDAAHYFDPTDIQAMSDAINEVLTDAVLRQTLISRGQVQANKYSWRRTARQTLAVYDKVLGS